MNVEIDGVRYMPVTDPCEDPELLDFVHDFYDAGGRMSIREYLGALLRQLWDKGESFSGKRPFGNSGWEYSLYVALARAGAVEADLDEDECLNSISNEEKVKANTIVFGLISKMCEVPK